MARERRSLTGASEFTFRRRKPLDGEASESEEGRALTDQPAPVEVTQVEAPLLGTEPVTDEKVTLAPVAAPVEAPQVARRGRGRPKITEAKTGHEKVSYYLKPETIKAIKLLAIEENTDASAIVRAILERAVARRG